MSDEKKEEKKSEKAEAKKHFPSWRYHKSGKSKLVKDEAEEKALGLGWAHSPAEFEEKAAEEKPISDSKKVDEKKEQKAK